MQWQTPSRLACPVNSMSVNNIDTPHDPEFMAAAQEDDDELRNLRNGPTALKLEQHDLPNSRRKLWCYVFCGLPRPYIPQPLRRRIFQHYHSLAHPRILATQRLLIRRFVWAGMKLDFQDVDSRLCSLANLQSVPPHPDTNITPPDAYPLLPHCPRRHRRPAGAIPGMSVHLDMHRQIHVLGRDDRF